MKSIKSDGAIICPRDTALTFSLLASAISVSKLCNDNTLLRLISSSNRNPLFFANG